MKTEDLLDDEKTENSDPKQIQSGHETHGSAKPTQEGGKLEEEADTTLSGQTGKLGEQGLEHESDQTTVRTIGQMRALIMDFPTSLLSANFFKAFSDGTRLRLLQALSVREMCVSDLCTLLELSQPAISNHLRVLNHQRIVKMRRSGKNIFYSLDDWHINAIIGMAMEHLSFTGTERM